MIGPFRGKYYFLSNFSLSIIMYESIQYSTVEHAFQAAKTTLMTGRIAISNIRSPGVAKTKGRQLILRPHWDEIKIGIMTDIVRIKFGIHELRMKLLNTGDEEIAEINFHGDNFWGVCGKLENGQNHLGIILMQIRQEIRELNV
jgi:ribA/ribD-fused uncharacterized protein